MKGFCWDVERSNDVVSSGAFVKIECSIDYLRSPNIDSPNGSRIIPVRRLCRWVFGIDQSKIGLKESSFSRSKMDFPRIIEMLMRRGEVVLMLKVICGRCTV